MSKKTRVIGKTRVYSRKRPSIPFPSTYYPVYTLVEANQPLSRCRRQCPLIQHFKSCATSSSYQGVKTSLTRLEKTPESAFFLFFFVLDGFQRPVQHLKHMHCVRVTATCTCSEYERRTMRVLLGDHVRCVWPTMATHWGDGHVTPPLHQKLQPKYCTSTVPTHLLVQPLPPKVHLIILTRFEYAPIN